MTEIGIWRQCRSREIDLESVTEVKKRVQGVGVCRDVVVGQANIVVVAPAVEFRKEARQAVPLLARNDAGSLTTGIDVLVGTQDEIPVFLRSVEPMPV